MLDLEKDGPPQDVITCLRDRGMTPGATGWTRLRGGRTNRIWRFGCHGQTMVCKLFAPNADTPLFPNDANAEARALTNLAGTGLAPRLSETFVASSGPVIVYDHVEVSAPRDELATARALARLHDKAPPPDLRPTAPNPQQLRAQGDAMLSGITDRQAVKLAELRPNLPDTSPFEQVFLHGDPVPANVLQTDRGPCFIDWQCPALGDPTEDLALYLSPAMQLLYGDGPLNTDRADAFLSSYNHPARIARYRQLTPLYHWRMAAYCFWKVQAGDADYAEAAKLEIDSLKQLGQPEHRARQTGPRDQVPQRRPAPARRR